MFFGTQTPHGGQAYAGAYAWISSFYRYGEYREYIETPLQSPLVAGTYEVSFWVSLADNCLYAVDNLGAHLSVGPITSTHKRALPFPPQVRNAAGRFLTSTNGWMLIQGTFTTSGGENYLTIGNLYDDLNTPILVAGGNLFLLSYYFIDDVTVRQIGTSCPTNKTVYSQTNVTFDTPTAYDACCGTNVTLTWSTVTNGTDITRTWVATDCCTNTNSCSQTITINTNISIIHAGWATDNGHNLIIDWTNISPYNWRMQHSPDLVHWLDATNALPPIVITNVLNVGVPMQFYRLVRTN